MLSQSPRQGRKNTTMACSSCRRRRTKCSGRPAPCVNCARVDGECCFETYTDGRTKASRRQRLDELENDQQLLKALLMRLRDNSDMRVAEITTCLPPGALDREYSIDTPNFTDRDSNTSSSAHSPVKENLNPRAHVSGFQEKTPDVVKDSGTKRPRQSQVEDEAGAIYMAPGAVRSFGNLAMSDAIQANRYPAYIQTQQLKVIYERPEICLPPHLQGPEDGMASFAANAVLSFQDAARSQIARGVAARKVLSMDVFDLTLFRRDRRPDDEHTVAGWACEWGKAWKTLPVELQLAAVYYIGSLIRWLVMPCEETYEMMAPLVRPLPSQLMIPHTIDVDSWGAPPIMRELQLLYGGRWLDHVTGATQRRLNWPHELDACTEKVNIPCDATSPDAVTDEQGRYFRRTECFSPAFIECLDKAESWTVNRDFLMEMSELEGHVEFHDD